MPHNWIRPLVLGDLTLENNLFQAPLAGYSSRPFRRLTWRLGRPGLLATEMISANALHQQAPRQERYLARGDDEGPISYQIWGRDPEPIGTAARRVTERGAATVDLNCGCPVRKVRAAGAGSKLMDDPGRVADLVRAMIANTSRPVTVKIRVGTGPRRMNGPDVAAAAAEAGAALVAVHGRHARESYSTPCRYGEIHRVVEAVAVPVIGNGDVRDGATARRMFEETGCAGLMIGRACMGAPWVFADIRASLSGTPLATPPLREVGEIFLEHHDCLVDLVGPDIAIRQVRKLGSFYSRGMRGAKEFRNRLNDCACREDLVALVNRFFGDAEGTMIVRDR